MGEHQEFILIIVLLLAAAFSVLTSIQRKGERRDALIGYLLEHAPDTVTRLDSNERVLRWTRGKRSLTVVYEMSVLKDLEYKYRDFDNTIALTGVIKSKEDFDNLLLKIMI